MSVLGELNIAALFAAFGALAVIVTINLIAAAIEHFARDIEAETRIQVVRQVENNGFHSALITKERQ